MNEYIENPKILVDDDGFYILNKTSSVFHIVEIPGRFVRSEEHAIQSAKDDVYEKNHCYRVHSLISDHKLNPGQKRKLDSKEDNVYKNYNWIFVIKNLDTNDIRVECSMFGKTLVLTK